MPHYPIFLDLEGKTVIVVGGGDVAMRKVETLLEYGAVVLLVSRELTPELKRYVDEEKVRYLGKEFSGDQLENLFMVIAATDDPVFNKYVRRKADEKGLLINVVDQPSDCNFIVPSILRRGDLVIAVSTSGRSPALAKKIRRELEGSFSIEYKSFLILLGRLRKEILARGLPQPENRRIFQELVNLDILDAIGSEDWEGIVSSINRIADMELSADDIMKYLEVR